MEPKNNYSVCFRGTISRLSDYLVSPIVTNGKDGDGLQLEKLSNFFKFSLLTDREITWDRSFRENLSQIFISC